MQVYVYRSNKQDEMYLYLRAENNFDCVPEALRLRFGIPEAALTFDLDSREKLARIDIAKLRATLLEQGFYLQMPPQIHAHLTMGE